MKEIYSEIEKDKLLHITYRLKDILDQESFRYDVVPPNNFLQLATLRLDKNQSFKPHRHIWKDGEDRVIAQESWLVIKGRVIVSLYDIEGENILYKPILHPGDCSITLAGGHTYEALEQETVVFEYKTGPYKGVENDKVFL
jgi:hypothetical protein